MKIGLLIIIIFILSIILYLNINKNNNENNENNEKFNNYYTYSKKIALLFLIKDDINKIDLWYNFIKNIDVNKYSIYIHYKNDNKLKYFNKYKLKETIPTKWGDISLVQAQKLLLKEAYKDKTNYKFIFLSDTCIPIKSFNYIYDFLTKNNNSYFNTEIIKNENYKTFQWFILNREHTQIIINDTTQIKLFENTFAPDETYFLTTLRKNINNNNNLIINKVSANFTTFVNWGDKFLYLFKLDDFNNSYKSFNSIKTKKNGSPYTYVDIDDKELNYLVNSTKCLFMRKVLSNTKLNESLLPY